MRSPTSTAAVSPASLPLPLTCTGQLADLEPAPGVGTASASQGHRAAILGGDSVGPVSGDTADALITVRGYNCGNAKPCIRPRLSAQRLAHG